MSDKGFRVEIPVHLRRDRRARKLAQRENSIDNEPVARAARLLALAWKWEGMVQNGEACYAEIARRHGLSRVRVGQICTLTLLAPDIQEAILQQSCCLPARLLRSIVAFPPWEDQRRTLS